MNIESALLKEHSRKQCLRIVQYVGSDKSRFKALMNCFLEGDYRLTQRAGWPMSYCIDKHPEWVKPYYKKFIAFLKKEDVHPAVRRNIVRLLQNVVIPEKWQGEIMDLCFYFIADPNEAAAVKAFSLTVLENLSIQYPDIRLELETVIEERWEHETAAFRSRAKKILKLRDKEIRN